MRCIPKPNSFPDFIIVLFLHTCIKKFNSNDLVIYHGHSLLKKEEESLQVKVDSFPVGANVHFPTDINLLWDSARKCIDLCEWFRDNENIAGWRKSASWKREIKSIFRSSSKVSSSGGKDKKRVLVFLSKQKKSIFRTRLKEKIILLKNRKPTRFEYIYKQ